MPANTARTVSLDHRHKNLKVTYRKVAELIARKNNARTHSKKHAAQITASVKAFGFVNPILADKTDTVIAGHGRLLAAINLGIEEVPVIYVDDLTPAQIRAYAIADNRLAEIAGWDKKILKIELQDLAEFVDEFDLTVTGFDWPEIEAIWNDEPIKNTGAERLELDPKDHSGPPVTRGGDLWLLGRRHRLLCGDAQQAASYALLLGKLKAQMVFTDPPYNVRIDGNVSGLGKTKHSEFLMASGEMSPDRFSEFLTTVFRNVVAYSADGSIAFVCMDWRHIAELMKAAGVFAEFKNLCVWNKTNAGMGAFYRSKHELVFVFKNGTAKHINNHELGQHGRHRTNVWDYPGATSLTREGLEDLALHPTVKPVALVADAIRDCSRRGGLILDPFMGSGSTLIAADITGRRAAGLELDPVYVDTAIRRWQRLTGEDAVLAADQRSFSEVMAERASRAGGPHD